MTHRSVSPKFNDKFDDKSYPIPQIPYLYFNTKTYFFLYLPHSFVTPSENYGGLFFSKTKKSNVSTHLFH